MFLNDLFPTALGSMFYLLFVFPLQTPQSDWQTPSTSLTSNLTKALKYQL